MTETEKESPELDFETQKLLFMAKHADDIQRAGHANLALILAKYRLQDSGCIQENFIKHVNNGTSLMANYILCASRLSHENASEEECKEAFDNFKQFYNEMYETLTNYRKSVVDKS